MLAHTRAAKKHAKILLFSDMGKFYHEKMLFLGDFLFKNQFCYLDIAKSALFLLLTFPMTGSYKSYQQTEKDVES
jgi:hypothetical protein